MDCFVTLIFLFFGFSCSSCSQFPVRTYHYVNFKMTWTEAQHYCRGRYTDLATIESMNDISMLKPTFPYILAWIGLRDDPESWKEAMGNDANSWRWSSTGETSRTGYHNWNIKEPARTAGNENCVIMGADGEWFDAACDSLRSFVCYTVTNQNEKTYVLISAQKTWDSARAYCRAHHTDLPVIESSAENSEVHSAKSADAVVWIGLYRVPWTWSDNTQSSFRVWRSGRPNNLGGNQFCTVEDPQHVWDDDQCSKKHSFICHQVSKLKTTLRMKIRTDADITDPAINAQILQQLGAVLTSHGLTDFNLKWNIQPRHQKTEKLTEPLM